MELQVRVRLPDGEWYQGWRVFSRVAPVRIGSHPDSDVRAPKSDDGFVSARAIRIEPAGGEDYKLIVVNRNGAVLLRDGRKFPLLPSGSKELLRDSDVVIVYGQLGRPEWEVHLRIVIGSVGEEEDRTGETLVSDLDNAVRVLDGDDHVLLTSIAVHAMNSPTPDRAALPTASEIGHMVNSLAPDQPMSTDRRRVHDRLHRLESRLARALFPSEQTHALNRFRAEYGGRDVVQRIASWLWSSGYFASLRDSDLYCELASRMRDALVAKGD